MSSLIDDVIAVLDRVKKWKWRTTRGLEEELRLSSGTLFPVLEEHANQKNRKIRYHRYPSRNLEVLWGLVTRVGEDPNLPPIRRATYPSGDSTRGVGPLIFVSHSHSDESVAVKIGQILIESGAQPWLFEMKIEEDQPIIHAVHESIQNCDGAVVYISSPALGSLWVHKEFGRALNEVNASVLVVLDGSDPQLVDAFQNSDFDEVERCMRKYTSSKDEIRRSRNFAADLFHHSERIQHPDREGLQNWVANMKKSI